jgi:hypothetical protein
MNPPKNYRLMRPGALIALLPETDIAGSGLTALLMGGAFKLTPDFYENLIASGAAKSAVIQADGRPVYRVIWEKLVTGEISILAAQALTADTDVNFLGAGLDALAALEKTPAILFCTARRGLVQQVESWGAKPVSLWFKKSYA